MTRWRFLSFLLSSLLILMPVTTSHADEPAIDYPDWLSKVALAAHQLDYQGVMVFQHNERMQISHIAHRQAHGNEITRVDALSGPARAWLNIDGKVLALNPDKHQVSHAPRLHHMFFPEILPDHADNLLQVYTLHPIGHKMIANRDAVGVAFMPRDAYRYGYLLWVDSATNLLLRLTKLDSRQQPAAQFTFTQIDIGTAPGNESLHAGFDHHPIAEAVHETTLQTPWHAIHVPPGYHEISASTLDLPDNQRHVTHLVYSDGLSTVSLFIEELHQPDALQKSGLFGQNMMNLYTRPLDNAQITALGEVPPATLMMMADSISRSEN